MKARYAQMRESIQRRLNKCIEKVSLYNTLFDIAVCASEESLLKSSTHPTENQFDIISINFNVFIKCYDNDQGVVGITIIDPASGPRGLVAELFVDVNGNIEKTFYNIPQFIYKAVMSYVNDLTEAFGNWQNHRQEE